MNPAKAPREARVTALRVSSGPVPFPNRRVAGYRWSRGQVALQGDPLFPSLTTPAAGAAAAPGEQQSRRFPLQQPP